MGRGDPVDRLFNADRFNTALSPVVHFPAGGIAVVTLAVRRMWGWTTMQAFYIATGAYGFFAWSV